ncbi:MAG: hypothetical protein BAJALOKI1v1_960005 [Promethearchaeota archaeon]|nr:MAG: hypothetical protein BAJALOKI1v1_960005 [Candidatus Lokiarchaeota archaeon]
MPSTLYRTHITNEESDVTIISDVKMAIFEAIKELKKQRTILKNYICTHKQFLTSFSPVKSESDEKIINLMVEGATIFNVGPMAAVAGALADLMLNSMKKTGESYPLPPKVVLIENGGEIAIDSEQPLRIALYAGHNELNANVGFLIQKGDCPLGIATSSATIGHAISLGEADAVTIFAKNATLADAGATKIANLVKGEDIEKSIKYALDVVDKMQEIQGAFISREGYVGTTGRLPQIIKIQGQPNGIVWGNLKNILPDDFELL